MILDSCLSVPYSKYLSLFYTDQRSAAREIRKAAKTGRNGGGG
jgi:hypothetical protein